MKLSSPSLTVPLTVLCSALFAVAALAQAPGAQQAPAEEHHHHDEPAPTNLKVLPKNLTGEQVHEMMHGWAAALGTECSTCHAADPKNIGPNGKPRLNYADDSKPEKATARLMYRMVGDINGNYVEKVENSGVGVTCGTCHRGHLDPPIFTPPPHGDHDHDHAPPPAGSANPSSR